MLKVKIDYLPKVSRDDLTRATQELTRMKADYGDVVPRRDFNLLEEKHTLLDEKFEKLNTRYKQLDEEHSSLLDIHQQVS